MARMDENQWTKKIMHKAKLLLLRGRPPKTCNENIEETPLSRIPRAKKEIAVE